MTVKKPSNAVDNPSPQPESDDKPKSAKDTPVPEAGGRGGLDPTRFGDWEKNGRCVDF